VAIACGDCIHLQPRPAFFAMNLLHGINLLEKMAWFILKNSVAGNADIDRQFGSGEET
jgi:hypothetical protein